MLGQYGNERWTSTDRRVISPKPPRGLATFTSELPRLLRRADAAEAWIEEKGLAVAVHTRRLEDPQAAYDRLLPLLTEAAEEPRPRRRAGTLGRSRCAPTACTRAPPCAGWSRSSGPRRSCSSATTSATSRPSRPSRSCAAEGCPGLLVCSASEEENALADLADVVVAGPDGVLDLLRELTADIRAARA